MSTKQSSHKNNRSNMSLGSALLLILVVALVRWYTNSGAAPSTGAPASAPDSAAQATLQPLQEIPPSSSAEQEAALDAEFAVATLSPAVTGTPAPTEKADLVVADTSPNGRAQAPPTRAPPTDTAQPTAMLAPIRVVSDLPLVYYDELPLEAHDTIALIESNGPFPFYKDGATFQNRERILPSRPNGYYREFTVITPHEGDRGARRIVAGEEGELYYTDDHYSSFREVVR